jgi:hypothetical protein
MGIEHNNAVDKVLAALRAAAPPEGMDARIAQRLADHATSAPATTSRWRNLFAGSTSTGAWWRGVIAGAASAMLAMGLILFAGHLTRPRADRTQIATRRDANTRRAAPGIPQSKTSTAIEPVSDPRNQLCVAPTLLTAQNVVPVSSTVTLQAESLAESTAPSHPAPELPLTAQERELVRLVHTADPKQLAALNLDEEAKLEAENAAEFARFFARPTPPPTPDVPPDANPEANPDNIPDAGQAAPDAKPEIRPETNEENPSPANEEKQ